MHFLPQETIEARFNIRGDEGVVIEAVGTISKGMTGMGFIYTNRECLSVGMGCLVSDFARTGETPYGLLEKFKAHPSIKPLLEGSEVKEYSAHLIPEGGFKAVPQLCGDGWVVVGDAAQLNNAVHREGSNLAMTSGRIAAEAIFQVKSRKEKMTKANLKRYPDAMDASFVMKDLCASSRTCRRSCTPTRAISSSPIPSSSPERWRTTCASMARRSWRRRARRSRPSARPAESAVWSATP
jgi:electron transfer flavoprotein-quinone oxidoreductase